MKTSHFFSLAAFVAASSLLFLSSCGTVGDGGDSPSNPQQAEPEPSSSSVAQQQPPPPPSSSSVTPPPPPPSSSSRPPSSSSRPSSSSSSLPAPSSSSVAEKPSKMIIELISYEEHELLDPGIIASYGDPKITVNVKSYVGDGIAKNATTKVLLDKDDIASWTGSAKDTVEIYPTAERIVVQPIILDKDVASDDDVSPAPQQISEAGIRAGVVFNNVIFSGAKASCTLNLTLIK